MKKIFSLLIINLLIINTSFSQHKHPLIKDVKIKLLKYNVNENMFGGAKMDCSKNIEDEEEERYKVYFIAKFYDFSSKKTIDFNNISLVDVDNKIRYRPIGVSSRDWYANSIKLEEYEYDDTFKKYSLDGIEDFDFFVYPTTKASFKNRKKPKYRYRIEPEHFKRKKGLRLYISFPAFKSREDSGNFKIYWKREVIGEFKIINGKSIY